MASIMNMLGGLFVGSEESKQPQQNSSATDTAQKKDDKNIEGTPDIGKLSIGDNATERPPPPAYTETNEVATRSESESAGNKEEKMVEDEKIEDESDLPQISEMDQRIMMMEAQLEILRLGPEEADKHNERVSKNQLDNMKQKMKESPEVLDKVYQQMHGMGYSGPKEINMVAASLIKNMQHMQSRARQALSEEAKKKGLSEIEFLEEQLEIMKNIARTQKEAAPVGPLGKPELRLEVNTHVSCNCGPQGWLTGKIVKHWYREATWPKGRLAPYQIQLDNGGLIYCPIDSNSFIRRIK